MLGNEAIGCGGRDCSVLGDAGDATGFVHVVIFSLSSGTQKGERSCSSERADPLSAHFNYGAEGGTKKGKITTHGMMDLLRSLHLA